MLESDAVGYSIASERKWLNWLELLTRCLEKRGEFLGFNESHRGSEGVRLVKGIVFWRNKIYEKKLVPIYSINKNFSLKFEDDQLQRKFLSKVIYIENFLRIQKIS